MRAYEIRSRFLDYFRRQGHAVLPSSSLVPAEDPTLLFVNAGMVQFKKVFLGLESAVEERRATTTQKCVRAGGKHNDLEQVGHTHRHHTFFEMLGNFSFGDYFKRDAIRFAWEFVTGPVAEGNLGLDPRHLRVSVFREDDEARALWREVAGLPDSRIYGLDEKDNFWQMADTGPCGPCSEIYVDLAHVTSDWKFPPEAAGEWTELDRDEFSLDAFVKGGDEGRFLEFWNLVFMQFDKQPDGTLVPLPRPSVDTGLGLERVSAIVQRVTANYHIDLFEPIIASIERAVGIPYEGRLAVRRHDDVDPASFRVIADHARAVAFLLADGVFPSHEGRGYVLRRILRRAVRHAWLLGRREPTLVTVVQTVIDTMSDIFPELRQRQAHIVETTRAEEERFLSTIDGGMKRFDEIAPPGRRGGTIPGLDAFRLYDTFGFPIDLTELMARERGFTVDIPGFASALAAQRTQSQEERRARKLGVGASESDGWRWESSGGNGQGDAPSFVGYDVVEIETQVTAITRLGGDRVGVMLRETPFYPESGGQISDTGEIVGDGWRVDVDDVRRIDGRIAAVGRLSGDITFSTATARVPSLSRRDTERNHTATHLLHAALRHVLGEHVHQAGSLVAPDRLRFDFTHHGPVKPQLLSEIEDRVNRDIWAAVDVRTTQQSYREAVAAGAMALFGEKYGEVVRVVSIPALSVELCGGTHVRNTAQIAVFRILSETGVAAGVRRIEAATGQRAFEFMRDRERILGEVSECLRTAPDGVPRRVQALLDEKKSLEHKLAAAVKGGGGQVGDLLASATQINASGRGAMSVIAKPIAVDDVRSLQALGDALREQMGSGVAALGATLADGKAVLLVVVSDDVRDRGLRADNLVRQLAEGVGGRGGGKPYMAQAGIPDPARLGETLALVVPSVTKALGG
ncbi:MAG: alanine--tRNA ligase [Gemmatimonadota bacterium]